MLDAWCGADIAEAVRREDKPLETREPQSPMCLPENGVGQVALLNPHGHSNETKAVAI